MNTSVIKLYSQVQTKTINASSTDVNKVELSQVKMSDLAKVFSLEETEYKSCKEIFPTERNTVKFKSGIYFPVFKNKFIDLILPFIGAVIEDGTDIVEIIDQFLTMGQMVYSTRVEGQDHEGDVRVVQDGDGTVDALNPTGVKPGEIIIDDRSSLMKKLHYMNIIIQNQIRVHFTEEVINEAGSRSAWSVFAGFDMWMSMNKAFTVLPLEKELMLIKNFMDGYKNMPPKELRINAEALTALVPTFASVMNYLLLMSAPVKVLEKFKSIKPNAFGLNRDWVINTETSVMMTEIDRITRDIE